ncbi:MAG: ankyrin repeat domain-containing protein [Thermoleophilaceae bacterium]
MSVTASGRLRPQIRFGRAAHDDLVARALVALDLDTEFFAGAEHGRLEVIDELLGAGTPVDGADVHGSTALHAAAYCGRADSVGHLLARGADPARRDARFGTTPLRWCRHRRERDSGGDGYEEVERLLGPVTPDRP